MPTKAQLRRKGKSDSRSNNASRVLLDERPLVLLPSLAKAVGVVGAIVIQQLHYYLANPKVGREHEGQRWIFNTYEQWQANDFPFWSLRTVRRIFQQLERNGLLIACQPEGRLSRRKYYRVNYGRIEKLLVSRPRARARQPAKLASSMRPKVALPLKTETSITKTSKFSSKDLNENKGFFAKNPFVSPSAFSEEDHRKILGTFRDCLYERFLSRWLPVTKNTDNLAKALERVGDDHEGFTRLCHAVARVCADPRFKGRGGEYSIPDGDGYAFTVPSAQQKHHGRNSIIDLIWDNYT